MLTALNRWKHLTNAGFVSSVQNFLFLFAPFLNVSSFCTFLKTCIWWRKNNTIVLSQVASCMTSSSSSPTARQPYRATASLIVFHDLLFVFTARLVSEAEWCVPVLAIKTKYSIILWRRYSLAVLFARHSERKPLFILPLLVFSSDSRNRASVRRFRPLSLVRLSALILKDTGQG